MLPETAKLIWDMREAATDITTFTVGKTYDDYRADKMLRLATERSFEIIGEAMSRLMQLDVTTAQQITDYRKIRAFRNNLAHGYDVIDHSISWAIITTKIPVLLSDVKAILRDEPPQ